MRRMLIASLGLIAVGAAVVVVIAHTEPRALAQQPAIDLADPDVIFSENPDAAAADKALYMTELDVAEAQVDSVESEPPSIRDQYIDLLRQKAELMSDEQIAESLEQLKGDISELEAERKLAEITAQLHTLVETYPETDAAKKAQTMLDPPIVVDDVYSEESETGGEAPFYPGPAPSSKLRTIPDESERGSGF